MIQLNFIKQNKTKKTFRNVKFPFLETRHLQLECCYNMFHTCSLGISLEFCCGTLFINVVNRKDYKLL